MNNPRLPITIFLLKFTSVKSIDEEQKQRSSRLQMSCTPVKTSVKSKEKSKEKQSWEDSSPSPDSSPLFEDSDSCLWESDSQKLLGLGLVNTSAVCCVRFKFSKHLKTYRSDTYFPSVQHRQKPLRNCQS